MLVQVIQNNLDHRKLASNKLEPRCAHNTENLLRQELHLQVLLEDLPDQRIDYRALTDASCSD